MRMHALTAALLSALIVAGCAERPAPTGETPMMDEAAFTAWVDSFVSHWNAGAWDTAAAMIGENAVLMQPDGPFTVGRGAIRDFLKTGYDNTVLTQSATVREMIPLGDHVYAHGTWVLQPKEGAGPGVAGSNGKWSGLYRMNADGTFESIRWMWNQEAGPAADAAG